MVEDSLPKPDFEFLQDSHGKWYWLCGGCGWAGLQCDTESFARREAAQHECKNYYI